MSVERILPWIEPEAVFVELARDDADLFWLDSGGTATGTDVVGTGMRAEVADVAGAPAAGTASTGIEHGGWVGWLDYEYGSKLLGVTAHAQPEARWIRADDVAVFDRAANVVRVRGGAAFCDRVAASAPVSPVGPADPAETAVASTTPDEHARRVEECRAAIRDGEAYQLCLTTRFTVAGDHDAVSIYRRLRERAPSHHGGFIRIGDTALCSISPEQFLEVSGTSVRTKPIKGTRPRGTDGESDASLAAELAEDPKERAENVMIVDLMRNDLSRVCQPGTVAVPELWSVETYPTVHQLVSTVTGQLRPGVTVGELWDAAFPAGSMTGAPKLRAMTILDALEDGPRGVYAGCFGWVGAQGGMDLAMVIRSVVVRPGEAYVGSGGGITWGSRAQMEVAEVGVKARVPLAALGSRCPEGW